MTASIRTFVCFTVLAACGGTSTPTGDDAPPEVDAGSVTELDPRDCTAIAQSFLDAAALCGTPLPGTAKAQFETMCKQGIADAAKCGGDPAGGFDCFTTPDTTDWVCAGGEPFPACNGDLAASLGMYCVIALGNPRCATGIQCQFNSDCSSGLSCNGATGQCFDTTAYCIGLPCEFNADCPAGETCNNAEGACIGQ